MNKKIKLDYNQHRMTVLEKHLATSGSMKRAYKELHKEKNWIAKLKSNSTYKENRQDILKTATKFYDNLYKKRPWTNLENDQEIYNIEPHEEVKYFDETEIQQLINKLKTRKSP